jgi:hypothetical protein
MKLARMFGIGPDTARQLQEVDVRSVRDLLKVSNLYGLSIETGISVETLDRLRTIAQTEWDHSRTRLKFIVIFGLVAAVLSATILVWALRNGISPKLDTANDYFNRGNAHFDRGEYEEAAADYRNSLGSLCTAHHFAAR